MKRIIKKEHGNLGIRTDFFYEKNNKENQFYWFSVMKRENFFEIILFYSENEIFDTAILRKSFEKKEEAISFGKKILKNKTYSKIILNKLKEHYFILFHYDIEDNKDINKEEIKFFSDNIKKFIEDLYSDYNSEGNFIYLSKIITYSIEGNILNYSIYETENDVKKCKNLDGGEYSLIGLKGMELNNKNIEKYNIEELIDLLSIFEY